MKELNPNYYGIIHADVRYDKTISPNAKVLYAEITALTNSKGYCWALNPYFAELYGVSERAIRKWLSQLSEKKYLKIQIGAKNNTRKIYVTERPFLPGGTTVPGGGNKGSKGEEQPDPHNTKENNKKNKLIEDLQKQVQDLQKKLKESGEKPPKKKNPKFIPPTLEQVQQYCTEKGMIERYAQVFLDYNENRDWKLKNNKKMKSWKAAFRNSMEYDWNQKYKLAEGEQPTPPEQDAHTLPEDKEKAYLKRVADIHKRTGGRISYFTRAEFASWLKGGHNFEKWRDRGWLETAITGKITKTITYLATSTFAQQLRGRLSDYVESAFAGNIKEL